MSTVRSMRLRPLLGSLSSGNSFSTSGHLVAPLAAADVDHDVHVGPLGKLVLHHGLAGAEGAGTAAVPPFARKQRVDDPLARHQGHIGLSFCT